VRVLITGIRGFIGGSFGRFVLGLGHQVTGTGRGVQPGEGWRGSYVQSDLSSVQVTNIVREFKPDVLLHAAGPASVGASLTNPIADLEGTANTCINVLEGVRQSDHDPLIVIASSAAVVGNPELLPVNEDAAVQPISPYGFHKAVSELLAREYAECFGLHVIACRFFSVFGVAQRRLLVWELYKQLAGPGEKAWLEGTGCESRDFLHVDDAAAAMFGLISAPALMESGNFKIINVGSGVETKVIALAEQLRNLVAPHKEISCRGVARPNDPLRWCADVSRLRSLLPSWQPRSLIEGLESCVNAWQRQS